MKKLLFLAGILTLFFTACSTVSTDELSFVSNSGSITPLDSLEHDWGDINIEGGDAEVGFHFINDGDEDLILNGVVTSCVCTSAYIELPDASISPTFGMHENPKWAYAVKPGEEFEVEVAFDPMAHGPNGIGAISRSIFLSTSAENQPDGVVEMKATANVLYDEEYQEQYGDSDFVFEASEFDFGVLKQSGGLVSHDFEFKYLGAESITVSAVPSSCACTSAEISKKEFKSGDNGVLTVTFDPNLHEEPEGVFFKTVSILTEPNLEKQPEIKIWAKIDLDLGPEYYKLSEEHND